MKHKEAPCCTVCLDQEEAVFCDGFQPGENVYAPNIVVESCEAWGLYKSSLALQQLRERWKQVAKEIRKLETKLVEAQHHSNTQEPHQQHQIRKDLSLMREELEEQRDERSRLEARREQKLDVYRAHKDQHHPELQLYPAAEDVELVSQARAKLQQKIREKFAPWEKKAPPHCKACGSAESGCGIGCIGPKECPTNQLHYHSAQLALLRNLWVKGAQRVRERELQIAGAGQRERLLRDQSPTEKGEIERDKINYLIIFLRGELRRLKHYRDTIINQREITLKTYREVLAQSNYAPSLQERELQALQAGEHGFAQDLAEGRD